MRQEKLKILNNGGKIEQNNLIEYLSCILDQNLTGMNMMTD